MMLTIDSLKEMGAFAPVDELIEKEVSWKQGGETVPFTVHVRPLSYKTAMPEIGAARDKQDPLAARIAYSICNEDGSPIFTVADVTGEADPERGPLSHAMTMALLGAISEVSELGKPRAS